MEWIIAVGNALGGPAKAEAFMRGRGISFILKSMKIDFKRPVTFPDTVSNYACLLAYCYLFVQRLHQSIAPYRPSNDQSERISDRI
jgi:hypothetical protein